MHRHPARFLPALLGSLSLLSAAPLASAAQADGVCDPVESQAGLCWVAPTGYVIEAVTGPNGEFPVIDLNGDSVFSYLITGPGVGGGSCQQVHDISHASIQFPSTCAGGDLQVLNAAPAPELLTNGQGDPSCGFGSGDLANDVLKWDSGVDCDESRTFTVVIEGVVPAASTAMSIKAGPNCMQGTILGPACPNLTRLCPSNPNSTGVPAVIDFNGSFSLSANDFTLIGLNLPPDQPGFYFFGSTTVDLPFGNGRRCIGGPQVRLQKIGIPFTGSTVHQFDTTQPPLDALVPGVPYYFQMYYRDPMGGGEGFNTTDALCIVFAP